MGDRNHLWQKLFRRGSNRKTAKWASKRILNLDQTYWDQAAADRLDGIAHNQNTFAGLGLRFVIVGLHDSWSVRR
jgi:hypothetical protein